MPKRYWQLLLSIGVDTLSLTVFLSLCKAAVNNFLHFPFLFRSSSSQAFIRKRFNMPYPAVIITSANKYGHIGYFVIYGMHGKD